MSAKIWVRYFEVEKAQKKRFAKSPWLPFLLLLPMQVLFSEHSSATF